MEQIHQLQPLGVFAAVSSTVLGGDLWGLVRGIHLFHVTLGLCNALAGLSYLGRSTHQQALEWSSQSVYLWAAFAHMFLYAISQRVILQISILASWFSVFVISHFVLLSSSAQLQVNHQSPTILFLYTECGLFHILRLSL